VIAAFSAGGRGDSCFSAGKETGGGVLWGAGSTAGWAGGRRVLTFAGAVKQALRSSRVNAAIPFLKLRCKGGFFLKAFAFATHVK
jgi:hypothetical protein